MASLRKLSLLLLLCSGALAVGCGSDPAQDDANADDDEADLTGEKCFQSPRRYDVSMGDGHACTDIRAKGGTWVASALFKDAPVSLQEQTCVVRWRASRRGNAPDPSVFTESSHVLMASPDCTSTHTVIENHAKPIPTEDPPPIIAHSGASGCDVCSVVGNGKIWVINPPWLLPGASHVNVPLTGGGVRTFSIDRPAGVPAFAAQLPPPPAGRSYVNGRVTMY